MVQLLSDYGLELVVGIIVLTLGTLLFKVLITLSKNNFLLSIYLKITYITTPVLLFIFEERAK